MSSDRLARLSPLLDLLEQQPRLGKMLRSCLLALAVSTALTVPYVAAQEGDFSNPGNLYRPRFRYWQVLISSLDLVSLVHLLTLQHRLPDASVSADIVAKDISSLADIGAGGIEYLPFYFYGLVYAQLIPVPDGPIEPPTDWSIYGFGGTAFNELFKETLQAIKDQGNGFNIDFALGPNQGAGVPSEPGTEGLSYEIVGFARLVVKKKQNRARVSHPSGTRQRNRGSRGDIFRPGTTTISPSSSPRRSRIPGRARAVRPGEPHRRFRTQSHRSYVHYFAQ